MSKAADEQTRSHVSTVLFFGSLEDLIYYRNKLFKLWNDEFLSESLRQQDDVRSYTPDTETKHDWL